MADNWEDSDDEDFGTFECANTSAEAQKSSSNAAVKTPAWLLETQSIKSSSTATDTPSKNSSKTGSKESLQHEPPGVGDPYQALRHVDVVSPQHQRSLQNQMKMQQNVGISLSPPSSSVQTKATEESTTNETSSDSNIRITQLLNKLNTAVAMKEQSEKNLKDLRLELKKQLEEMKSNHQLEIEKHKKEMMIIKSEHEQEIVKMQQQYAKTSEIVRKQMDSVYKSQIESERLENEKNITRITEHCLDLLNRQEETLSNKLKESLLKDRNDSDSIKRELRLELEDSIRVATEEATERIADSNRLAIQQEMKKSIDKELEQQRTMTSQLQRETHEELMTSFKVQLKEEIEEERSRSEKKMCEVVEMTTNNVMESCQRANKRNEATHKRHVAAIQMLLNATQEHLSKLLLSNQDDDDPSSGDC